MNKFINSPFYKVIAIFGSALIFVFASFIAWDSYQLVTHGHITSGKVVEVVGKVKKKQTKIEFQDKNGKTRYFWQQTALYEPDETVDVIYSSTDASIYSFRLWAIPLTLYFGSIAMFVFGVLRNRN